MTRVVTLLTDFGASDTYVAEVKAVLISALPGVTLVDLTHDIPPFNVEVGAFNLMRAHGYFPKGTYHLAVVDPGVGSRRRCVYVRTPRYHFIGPDNGLLRWAAGAGARWYEIPVAEGTPPTFHGRDVFAPFLTRLAKGKPGKLKPVTDPEGRDFPEPRLRGGTLHGEILVADRFGNLVTSLRMTPGTNPEARVRRGVLRTVGCYADIPPGEACLLPGSHGFWEVACRNASAAAFLDMGPGDEIAFVR